MGIHITRFEARKVNVTKQQEMPSSRTQSFINTYFEGLRAGKKAMQRRENVSIISMKSSCC